MELKILGSSSSGNCYILENEKEALIIEAGIRFIEVKKALNFNMRKVVGCLISHQHNDHAKYAKNIQQKTGKLTKDINLVLSFLTAFVAVFSMIKLIYKFINS